MGYPWYATGRRFAGENHKVGVSVLELSNTSDQFKKSGPAYGYQMDILTESNNGRMQKASRFVKDIDQFVPTANKVLAKSGAVNSEAILGDVADIEKECRYYEVSMDKKLQEERIAWERSRMKTGLESGEQKKDVEPTQNIKAAPAVIKATPAVADTVVQEFVLTHRTDLKERIVPRALPGDHDNNSGQTKMTPIQAVRGRFLEMKQDGSLLMDIPKHGEVLVHTNRPEMGRKDGDVAKAVVREKGIIGLKVDNTGRGLFLEGTGTLRFESPAAPKYLVPESTQSVVRGELKEFYDRCCCVEVVENGQNVLLRGRRGEIAGTSETNMRKMLGKNVEAKVYGDGRLRVKPLEIDKKMGLSR